jgi:hypothetical protein
MTKIFLIFYYYCSITYSVDSYERGRIGLEKLLEVIFDNCSYNNIVRPFGNKDGITVVNTELKLLQIDLVNY